MLSPRDATCKLAVRPQENFRETSLHKWSTRTRGRGRSGLEFIIIVVVALKRVKYVPSTCAAAAATPTSDEPYIAPSIGINGHGSLGALRVRLVCMC